MHLSVDFTEAVMIKGSNILMALTSFKKPGNRTHVEEVFVIPIIHRRPLIRAQVAWAAV